MNQSFTFLAEKYIALAQSAQNMSTPNPFRPVDGRVRWIQSADPEDFYAVPKSAPKITFHTEWPGIARTRARFSFPSLDKSPYPENNTVYGLASIARRVESRAALIVVHGHRMNSFSMFEWFAIPAAQHGLDLYYITLPFHMQRAPKGTWSGQLMLNSNVEGTALGFRQGVRDVRSLISWILQERGTPVGLVGASLGAFTSCMTAVVDARITALVSVLGGGSLAQVQWDGYMQGRPRHQLLAGGISRAQLEQYWSALAPANWKPKIAKDRILLMAGKYDPIVTPGNVERLWRAWDKPEIHWYPCGHGTIGFYYRPVVAQIVRFLKTRLLPDEETTVQGAAQVGRA